MNKVFGIPSRGLEPHEIGSNDDLAREIYTVLRAHYRMLSGAANVVTAPTNNAAFGHFLSDGHIMPLVEEARKRAEGGCQVIGGFLQVLDRHAAAHPHEDPEASLINCVRTFQRDPEVAAFRPRDAMNGATHVRIDPAAAREYGKPNRPAPAVVNNQLIYA